MPTYEYICNACGHEFEKFQSIKAAPVKDCPTCRKRKVERKISVGAGFIFKGSGFYETDYRNESYRKAAEAEKSPAGESKGGDAKSDSKPAEAKSVESKAAEPTSVAAQPKPATIKPDAKPKAKRKG